MRRVLLLGLLLVGTAHAGPVEDLAERLQDVVDAIPVEECVEDAKTPEDKALAKAKDELLALIFTLNRVVPTKHRKVRP